MSSSRNLFASIFSQDHHGLCTFVSLQMVTYLDAQLTKLFPLSQDVILVVDKGRAAEFGTPAELLSNEDSIFSQLVESTGKESSVALRSMVLDS